MSQQAMEVRFLYKRTGLCNQICSDNEKSFKKKKKKKTKKLINCALLLFSSCCCCYPVIWVFFFNRDRTSIFWGNKNVFKLLNKCSLSTYLNSINMLFTMLKVSATMFLHVHLIYHTENKKYPIYISHLLH